MDGYQPVLTLSCANCANCPQVLLSDTAPVECQVVIIDDSGGKVEMSRESFNVLLAAARDGSLTV